MRLSRMLAPTTKEIPSDAVLPSHIYLLRGGFIQNAGGSGLYNLLPLGKRVLDKIITVIKQELDSVGCQEVSLAFVTPASLWHQSGRYEKYGKELLRFQDRKNNDFVLGPTHEEAMVTLVKQSIKSYKQLPLNLYQINLKFRDEVRPRFGLMRGREFWMKDGYSFHRDEDDMKREFALMEKVYRRIFTRLGLDFRVVEADSGAIGGSGSKEFMVLANSGEDTIVVCNQCEYSANIEAAKRKMPHYERSPFSHEQHKKISTPNVSTIEQLQEFFGVKEAQFFVKTVAKYALYDGGERKIVLFALRGDDTLQEIKAANAVGANELSEIDDEALKKAQLAPGYMSPIDPPEGIEVVYDHALKGAVGLVCGGNEDGLHIVGCSADHFAGSCADIAQVRKHDQCPNCQGELVFTKGIEVGHIFQLGTRYTKPLGCEVLDENGKPTPVVMGTYGIGVSRLIAAIIEQHHDEKGCVWTKHSSPFDMSLIVSNAKDQTQLEAAEALYETLKKAGIDVLFDDRKDRYGSKMSDFELMGIPYAVIIGKKLSEGAVEFLERRTMRREDISFDRVVEHIKVHL